jgi:hypothetical protein
MDDFNSLTTATYHHNPPLMPLSFFILSSLPFSFFTMSTGGGELFFHLKKKGIILEKEVKFYLGR